MPNVFSQWAVHHGGAVHDEFEQSGYIAQFPPYLRGGCCMTLCICWMAARGNMTAFQGFIHTEIGKAHVRGFQGLGVKAGGPAAALGGDFVGYAYEVMKIFGIRFQGEVAIRDNASPNEVAQFVSNREAFYQLHFRAIDGRSAHAVAFRNTGDSLQLFDPNYGLAVFSGGARRTGFRAMCSTVLGGSFYPDLVGHWECMRVYW